MPFAALALFEARDIWLESFRSRAHTGQSRRIEMVVCDGFSAGCNEAVVAHSKRSMTLELYRTLGPGTIHQIRVHADGSGKWRDPPHLPLPWAKNVEHSFLGLEARDPAMDGSGCHPRPDTGTGRVRRGGTRPRHRGAR